MKNSSHLKLRALCEGAIFVALAQVLGYIKLFELPQGGSVGIGMLPIFIYCARWGFGPGMLASIAYSVLQLLLDGAYAWGWQSILLDYVVAYAAVGLAGLTRKMPKFALPTGALVGGLIRFVVHFISGITIYKIVGPTELFNVTYTDPWMYSLAYNMGYMLPSTLLVAVLGLLLQSRLEKIKK